jgi:uncharacterized membrane protein YciS (DUF1049 family)
MTFALMLIIGFALFLKIMIGAIYTIKYRCSNVVREKNLFKNEGRAKDESKVQKYF